MTIIWNDPSLPGHTLMLPFFWCHENLTTVHNDLCSHQTPTDSLWLNIVDVIEAVAYTALMSCAELAAFSLALIGFMGKVVVVCIRSFCELIQNGSNTTLENQTANNSNYLRVITRLQDLDKIRQMTQQLIQAGVEELHEIQADEATKASYQAFVLSLCPAAPVEGMQQSELQSAETI